MDGMLLIISGLFCQAFT